MQHFKDKYPNQTAPYARNRRVSDEVDRIKWQVLVQSGNLGE